MTQKVVVIGHGYTSRLGIIRALGRAGYEVIVVVITNYRKLSKKLNTTKPIDCYSKYVSQVFYCPPDKELLINLLIDKCSDQNQKVVLFPDSDFSEATIDEKQECLRKHFLFPYINHEAGLVVAWMDKLRQKQVARELGLNVADGLVIEVRGGSYKIPSELNYPCFPKPLSTILGGKTGLKRCDNEKQLRLLISKIASRNSEISILVEEYKKIDVEHALLGFSDGKDVVVPGIIKTTLLANGGHFGVAKQGDIIPITGYEELVEKFKQFVKKTGFVGIFDIDFYKSDNKYYFCEMNFRYGGSGYAYTAMGVNLPTMMVRFLKGEDIRGMQLNILNNASFVNERMCVDDWIYNYITKKELLKLLDSVDISFVDDAEDPEPGRHFRKRLWNAETYIKKTILWLMRRR